MVWPECCGVHAVKGLGCWVFLPFNKNFPWKHILLVNQKRRLSSIQHFLAIRPALIATFECSPMVSSHGWYLGYILGENMAEKYSGLTIQVFFFLLLNYEDFFTGTNFGFKLKSPVDSFVHARLTTGLTLMETLANLIYWKTNPTQLYNPSTLNTVLPKLFAKWSRLVYFGFCIINLLNRNKPRLSTSQTVPVSHLKGNTSFLKTIMNRG